jgi:hypothetical protein
MRLTIATLFALSSVVLAGPIGDSPLSPADPYSPDTLSSPLYGEQSNRIIVRDSGWGGIPPSSNHLGSTGPDRVEKRAAEGDAIHPKPIGYEGRPKAYQTKHDIAERIWGNAIRRHPEAYAELQQLDTKWKELGQAHGKWIEDRGVAMSDAMNGVLSKDEKDSFAERSRALDDKTREIQGKRANSRLQRLREALHSKMSVAGRGVAHGGSSTLLENLRPGGLAIE